MPDDGTQSTCVLNQLSSITTNISVAKYNSILTKKNFLKKSLQKKNIVKKSEGFIYSDK